MALVIFDGMVFCVIILLKIKYHDASKNEITETKL